MLQPKQALPKRTPMDILQPYRDDLAFLKAQGLSRSLPQARAAFLDFSSNDYLALARHEAVIEAGIEAARTYGAGSTGSRLLSGNSPLFEEFEAQIARDKHTDAALIFNSGFQANVGALSVLLDRHSVVVFDRLNHASMYQGVFLSGANLQRYDHLAYDQLEDLLQRHQDRRCLIASETVFGMDGDKADVTVLLALAQKYNALLYLDEAHATGLYGPEGYGLATEATLDPERTVVMNTFSKALGSSGACVASNRVVVEALIQRGRTFIYSTALSPFCIGAARKAWTMVRDLEDVRTKLLARADCLRNVLKVKGFTVPGQETNILPILMKDNATAEGLHRALLEKGIVTSFIRRPTSPTPRLRVALTAAHTEEDIEKLLEGLVSTA